MRRNISTVLVVVIAVLFALPATPQVGPETTERPSRHLDKLQTDGEDFVMRDPIAES